MSATVRARQDAQPSTEWWRNAAIYQIYPRSFADGNGDGIGDLPGITSRLEHIADLGVDAVWLSPFYVSPQHDAGYDVADFRDVDPIFGTLADADALIARAHELGLKVIVDMVPNHTSQRARVVQGGRRSPRSTAMCATATSTATAAARSATSRPTTGPPSSAARPGRARPGPTARAGQWYLHLFDSTQPDLNWSHPDVQDDFDGILRFWLDRGVDGFRVDVAHGLIKEEGLPDHFPSDGGGSMGGDEFIPTPYFGQEGVHDVWRRWRRVLAEYGPERILVAEAWIYPLERMANGSAPTRCTRPSTSRTSRPRGTPRRSARSSRSLSRRSAQSARRAPGCSPITTSCATRAASP